MRNPYLQDWLIGGFSPPRLLTRLVAGIPILTLVLASSFWLGLGTGQAMATAYPSASSAPRTAVSTSSNRPNIVVIWGSDIAPTQDALNQGNSPPGSTDAHTSGVPRPDQPKLSQPMSQSQTQRQFSDIRGNLYEQDILAAANQYGIVAGDDQGRFNPNGQLTREQAVSMILEGLKQRLGANQVVVSATVNSAPFPDVQTNRWSAAKIAWAKTAGIVAGDDRGRFNPTDPVSRAALMAMLSQALTYEVRSRYGPSVSLDQVLPPDPSRQSLSDLQGHWAKAPIQRLESYGIASPNQEVGTAFRPNDAASRAFAAAAMVRLMRLPMPNPSQGGAPTDLPRSAVLNQPFATIERYFGRHLGETTYTRDAETWTERTYAIAGLRQRLPTLPPQAELQVIFVDGLAQWILLNPSAESSMPDPSTGGWQDFNYGPAEAAAFFDYIFGYRPSRYTPIPGHSGGGHEGFYENAICLGDGIQTTFIDFIGGIANIRLSYNEACEAF